MAKPLRGRTVLLCLIGFFAVVAGVNAVMIVVAIKTFGGVETASSYKAGLAFAREVAAADAQRERRWDVRASVEPDGRGSTRVALTAAGPDGRPLTGLSATVRLSHPTDRRADRPVEMMEIAPGRYSGVTSHVAGQWDLVIDLDGGGERLFRSKSRLTLKQGS